jgi:hypothetical protein
MEDGRHTGNATARPLAEQTLLGLHLSVDNCQVLFFAEHTGIPHRSELPVDRLFSELFGFIGSNPSSLLGTGSRTVEANLTGRIEPVDFRNGIQRPNSYEFFRCDYFLG